MAMFSQRLTTLKLLPKQRLVLTPVITERAVKAQYYAGQLSTSHFSSLAVESAPRSQEQILKESAS